MKSPKNQKVLLAFNNQDSWHHDAYTFTPNDQVKRPQDACILALYECHYDEVPVSLEQARQRLIQDEVTFDDFSGVTVEHLGHYGLHMDPILKPYQVVEFEYDTCVEEIM